MAEDGRDDNGRVTLALLKRDTEELKRDTEEIKAKLDRLGEAWQRDHDRIGVLETKQGALAIGQSVLTLIGSTVAAFLGMRR